MDALIAVFVAGYALIVLEHGIKLEKAAVALLLGIALWTMIALGSGGHSVEAKLSPLLVDIAGIVFFLLGAMTIVEVIDGHGGFEVLSRAIRARGSLALTWTLSLLTFVLSAILDNLTTTIVMISLVRKLLPEGERRLLTVGLIVIAANSGGAFSPIGDVTTTMLWIGGKLTAGSVIAKLFLPSLASLLVPLLVASLFLRRLEGPVASAPIAGPWEGREAGRRGETLAILLLGVGLLVAVPFFKILTGLPPWIAMLGSLSLLWVATGLLHLGKDRSERARLGPAQAFARIDLPSLVFFIGILLAVGALEARGILHALSDLLAANLPDERISTIALGLLSAVVDNVPLVAGAMGVFDPAIYPTDHRVWDFLAFCAGTGGSLLVIGSAAGVVAMGLERITFGWYLGRIAPLAALGYAAGVGVLFLG